MKGTVIRADVQHLPKPTSRTKKTLWLWVAGIERHEALLNPAVLKGHRWRPVAAGCLKLRAS